MNEMKSEIIKLCAAWDMNNTWPAGIVTMCHSHNTACPGLVTLLLVNEEETGVSLRTNSSRIKLIVNVEKCGRVNIRKCCDRYHYSFGTPASLSANNARNNLAYFGPY